MGLSEAELIEGLVFKEEWSYLVTCLVACIYSTECVKKDCCLCAVLSTCSNDTATAAAAGSEGAARRQADGSCHGRLETPAGDCHWVDRCEVVCVAVNTTDRPLMSLTVTQQCTECVKQRPLSLTDSWQLTTDNWQQSLMTCSHRATHSYFVVTSTSNNINSKVWTLKHCKHICTYSYT